MLSLTLIVLIGINIRTVLLAVPPVLPLITHDLHLSYTETGLMSSLPTLVMGAASLPVGILIGCLGGRMMVAVGLALIILGGVLRALWPTILPLYFFTIVLSLGCACSQTAIPTLIRQWFSTQIGLATALYSDGLVTGETLGAVLTIPLVLGWLGRDAWIESFLFWSIPVVVILLLWLWLAPPAGRGQLKVALVAPATRPISRRHPGKRLHVNAWTLGLLLGGAQLIYFGANGWIASYNQAVHVSSITWLALGALNAAQIPASLIVTIFANRLIGRRLPFIAAGAFCLLALLGWVWASPVLEPLWATLLGSASIVIYTLGLALPALLAEPQEIAKWTGTMLTVGYLFAFLGPFAGGWLWDMTQIPAIAFLPLLIGASVVLALGILLPLQRPVAVPGNLTALTEVTAATER
jgi:CP family cyanate transporter-like MFS transporter